MKRALLGAAALFSAQAATAQNLVTNGDFSLGNTGFTSDYAYSPAGNDAAGQYAILTNPYPWNPFFVSIGDHTTGTGFMMVGNGSSTAGDVVWQSGPIAITSGTDYFFEAFVANVCCNDTYGGGNSSPVLTFSVSLDGGPTNDLATLSIPLNPAGQWYGLSTLFNSGAATTATLSLVNANTEPAGNDFALDDVFLGTQSSVVPEPATWAMMLLGFGAIGLTSRRRKHVLSQAA